MPLTKLLRLNMLRNRRVYGSFFLSSSFAVLIFYIFAMLYYHPKLQVKGEFGVNGSSENVTQLANIGLTIAQVVIVIFAFILLVYSMGIMMKSRRRDLGIFMMLGMSRRDLKKMVFVENFLIGVAAITTGIISGMIFSKIVLLIGQNLLGIDKGLPFYLPIKPVVMTTIIFLIFFLVLSLLAIFTFRTKQLAELVKVGEQPRKSPKMNWFLVLLAVASLVAGYGIVLDFAQHFNDVSTRSMNNLLIGTLLTIFGTFFFFQQFLVAVTRWLQKRKFYWHGQHMLVISELAYRLKENAVMYFMLSIVAAVAFVGIGVCRVMAGPEFAGSQDTPFAYTYMYFGDKSTEKKAVEAEKKSQRDVRDIEKNIQDAGYQPKTFHFNYVYFSVKQKPKDLPESELPYNAISETEYNKVADFMGFSKIHLKDKEFASFGLSSHDVRELKNQSLAERTFTQNIVIGGKTKMTVKQIRQPLQRFTNNAFLAVVSDQFFESLKEKMPSTDVAFSEPDYYIHFKEWQKAPEVAKKIDNMVKERGFNNYNSEEGPSVILTSLYDNWKVLKQTNGLILLISVLLGTAFFAFASSILYFRLFGEVDRDAKYQHSLYLLGIQRKVRKQVVTKQMLVMFFLPIVVAGIHFAVAMYAFHKLGNFSVTTYYWQILLIYLVFQLCFFLIARNRYWAHLEMKVKMIR